jgi:hypothetical protein
MDHLFLLDIHVFFFNIKLLAMLKTRLEGAKVAGIA